MLNNGLIWEVFSGGRHLFKLRVWRRYLDKNFEMQCQLCQSSVHRSSFRRLWYPAFWRICLLMLMFRNINNKKHFIWFELEEIVTNRKTMMSYNDKELDNNKARRNLTSERCNIFFLAQLWMGEFMSCTPWIFQLPKILRWTSVGKLRTANWR